jgi:DNA-binding MarR family transcriptional regulator
MNRFEVANSFFFRLYQCTNMMHKTGTRAVQEEGLTTQQWAVMGALSRPGAKGGMGVTELARYLLVSRQNLSGVLKRMEAAGYIQIRAAVQDRRSRIVKITSHGRDLWTNQIRRKIELYYDEVLEGLSDAEITEALRFMQKLLENMKRIDQPEELEEKA